MGAAGVLGAEVELAHVEFRLLADRDAPAALPGHGSFGADRWDMAMVASKPGEQGEGTMQTGPKRFSRTMRMLMAGSALHWIATAAPALAQEAVPAEVANEDIVVTARFRTEMLQDTPVAISAVSATTLENIAVTDVNSLQRLLPNVQLGRVNFSGQALSASIRGISFADLEKTFDPAIGVSIDGVFLGTNTGANNDFDDIESIEVLRGPQGTLYGRNTIGGTISVRYTKPTGEFGVKLKGRYGTFNTVDIDGIANLPRIADALSIKLSGLRRTSDSPTTNRYTGKRELGRDAYNLGVTALLDLGDVTRHGACVMSIIAKAKELGCFMDLSPPRA